MPASSSHPFPVAKGGQKAGGSGILEPPMWELEGNVDVHRSPGKYCVLVSSSSAGAPHV